MTEQARGPVWRSRPIAGSQQFNEAQYLTAYEEAEQRLQRALTDDSPALIGLDWLFSLHKMGLLPQWPWVTGASVVASLDGAVEIHIQAIAAPELLDVLKWEGGKPQTPPERP